MNYVTHTCKNSKLSKDDNNYCNNAFIDKDTHHAVTSAPTWRYCPECISKGFSNTNKKLLTELQIITISKMREGLKAKKLAS